MQRIFRIRSTGQWCAPSILAEGFPDDGTALADRVAATLGLAAGALEVVDFDETSEPDQRGPDPSKWLAEDVPEPPPPPPPSKLDRLLDAIESSPTLPADLKAAVRGIKVER